MQKSVNSSHYYKGNECVHYKLLSSSDDVYYIDKSMEKQAGLLSTLGHLGMAGAVHLTQNQLAKRFLASKGSQSLYRSMFNHGVRGLTPNKVLATKKGLASVAVPEINTFSDLAQNLGKGVEEYLSRTHLKSYKHLKPEHKLFLKDIAGGNFEKALPKLTDPDYRHVLASYTHGLRSAEAASKNPMAVDELISTINKYQKHITAPPLKGDPAPNFETLRKIEKVYKDSYLGKTLPAMFQTPSTKEIKSLLKSKPKGLGVAHLPAEVAGNAALSYVDPASAAFNVFKRFMSSPVVQKIPGLNKVQDFSQKVVVTNPIKHTLNSGLRGEYKSPTGYTKVLFEDVINPVHADLKDTAGRIGDIIYKSPERVYFMAHKQNYLSRQPRNITDISTVRKVKTPVPLSNLPKEDLFGSVRRPANSSRQPLEKAAKLYKYIKTGAKVFR